MYVCIELLALREKERESVCVAVCGCSVWWQCVAVCGRLLQCVAVCRSMLYELHRVVCSERERDRERETKNMRVCVIMQDTISIARTHFLFPTISPALSPTLSLTLSRSPGRSPSFSSSLSLPRSLTHSLKQKDKKPLSLSLSHTHTHTTVSRKCAPRLRTFARIDQFQGRKNVYSRQNAGVCG